MDRSKSQVNGHCFFSAEAAPDEMIAKENGCVAIFVTCRSQGTFRRMNGREQTNASIRTDGFVVNVQTNDDTGKNEEL
jgi:hypothetical protein